MFTRTLLTRCDYRVGARPSSLLTVPIYLLKTLGLRSAVQRLYSSMAIDTIDPFRLPDNVKPTHYDLTVFTDLEKLRFEGFVKIK
jgi:hypothetical protein